MKMSEAVQGPSEENQFVYLDIQIGTEKAGRIIIELFNRTAPKTVDNFRALCTGECGLGKNGKPLHYKGTIFHRVVPQFMVQGGDITGDNLCEDSIYGGKFVDENFVLLHDIEGVVGMANNGPNTNSSQFYITMVPCPHLDGINVAFGYVRKGLNIIREITDVPRTDDKPTENCTILDCGEIKSGTDFKIDEDDGTTDVFPPWPDDYDFPDSYDAEKIISQIKDAGNFWFNRNNYVDSDRKYRKVLRYIDWVTRKKLHHNCMSIKSMEVQTLLNLAAVRLKQHKYKDAIEICTQVLQCDPNNGKALYRRGQARLKMNDYDKAVNDLQVTLKMYPNNVRLQKQFATAKEMKQKYLEKERIIYSKMFA